MSNALNPLAPHHLPGFITAPGETDVLMVGGAIFLIIAVLGLGSVYFRLHSLPEKLAHGNASKVQFEVVAVLGLLALLTHTNWLWVAALILALVPIPDLHGPLERMADALGRMAGLRRDRDIVAAGDAPAVDEVHQPAPEAVAPPPEAQEPQPLLPARS
ncbi:MAG: hypothetical protein NTV73_04740 [Hyphomicrobiales bacterium]|nr:hypothetical protein [Hyphomicrobiales bacterium]